ncbi:SubName: Full=Uncharacterized protein {ECO:0000313/EMBL:CCA71153.1} [Serendipita indica DSM 11827]|uniref:Uncharacterized protein n=1 Tax=Serendipita indica (strain DSM 11827) TaxID=1109443 RepID=G4TIL0_SERID|nr:SubName: Full=Uncharacterized protein {ECO:0000313/EMBL:CCA71153.1} [Serendipita indica DSM 11827]CCA71153.1 hypothetical protein PIIN_05088 [Serendipita indica DSM 11827]
MKDSPSKEIYIPTSADTPFPRLEYLRIHEVYEDLLIKHITSTWKMRVLRVLSITGSSPLQWTRILEESKDTLQVVELIIPFKPHERPTPIKLPHLTSLFMGLSTRDDPKASAAIWTDVIEAPGLKTLGWSRILQNHTNFWTFVERAITRYPKVSTIRLVGHTPTGLNTQFAQSRLAGVWLRSGLLIEAYRSLFFKQYRVDDEHHIVEA